MVLYNPLCKTSKVPRTTKIKCFSSTKPTCGDYASINERSNLIHQSKHRIVETKLSSSTLDKQTREYLEFVSIRMDFRVVVCKGIKFNPRIGMVD